MKLAAIKDIVSYGVTICIIKGASLLLLPVVTRYLTPVEYGQLELLTISSSFIALFASCSLHEALYRFAAVGDTPKEQVNAKSCANQIFTMSILVSLCLLICIGLGATLLGHQVELLLDSYGLHITHIVILSISLCIGSSLSIGLAWLRMNNDVNSFIKISIATTVFQALLVVSLLECDFGVTSVLAAGLVTHIFQWIWIAKVSTLRLVLPAKSLILEAIRYAAPLTASAIVAFGLNGAERWLILFSSNLHTLGQYAIASKFALATCILIQPFGMWWMPKRFALLKQDTNQAARISLIGIIYIGFLIVTIAAISQLVLPLILIKEYHSTVILILGTLFMSLGKELTEIVNLGLLYRKQTKTLFAANVITTLVGITACVILSEHGVWAVMIVIGVAQLVKALWIFRCSQTAYMVFTSTSIIFLVPVIVTLALFSMYWTQSWLIVSLIAFISLLVFVTLTLYLFMIADSLTAQRSIRSLLVQLRIAHE